MNILVTGANGQLGNGIRIVSAGSADRYIFTDVNEAGQEQVAMLRKLAGPSVDISTRRLDICDIEMEVRKKDGTMTPACNISVDNTPWTVLNTAARIAVGIDISNAFCRHNDVHIPLVLDNMEMVDSDREIASDGRQTIVFRRNDCEFTVINR